MKLRHLILLTLFLAGCAAQTKRPHTVQERDLETLLPSVERSSTSYVGVRGYLNRPPVFTTSLAYTQFQRCQPIQIMGVKTRGGKIFVQAKQGNQSFEISGLNRKPWTKKTSGRLPLLDRHFVKDLDWAPKTGRALASNEKVCAGQTWRDMSSEQFQFINGDPERRQAMQTDKGSYDVWTYVGANKSAARHYYFFAGYLYSWTQ
jgi:hypothetical protein